MARTLSVDATLATEPVVMSILGGSMSIPPGAVVTLSESNATQPIPPNEAATASADNGKESARADTGKAGKLLQSLGALSSLVWIGAVCVIAGVFITAIWFKMRGTIGYIGSMPWWLGPAVSGCGVLMWFAPTVVEIASGPIVAIGLTVIGVVIVIGVLVAWRNRKKIENDLGIDLPFTESGIGK